MECNEYTVVKVEGDKEYIVGTIYADTFPGELPTDGANVVGLNANKVFAVGMSIFTPNGMKVLFPGGWQDA